MNPTPPSASRQPASSQSNRPSPSQTQSSIQPNDSRGNIPTFIHISGGKLHEVNVLDEIVPEPGAFYVMDRGYLDFDRRYRFHAEAASFVLRNKSNVVLRRRYSRPVDHTEGVPCDQTVVLDTVHSASHYPDALRRVHFRDPDTGQRLEFLTIESRII
jgi:hypothetical protein